MDRHLEGFADFAHLAGEIDCSVRQSWSHEVQGCGGPRIRNRARLAYQSVMRTVSMIPRRTTPCLKIHPRWISEPARCREWSAPDTLPRAHARKRSAT